MLSGRNLRILRFSAGILFLCLFLAFLVLPGGRPFLRGYAAFQVVPAFLSLTAGFSLTGLIGLLIVVLLTLLSGRVYCSTLCPFGVLQDLFTRLRFPFRKRRGLTVRAARKEGIFHAAFTLALLAVFLFGAGSLFGLFDPFSLSGRFFSGFLLPLLGRLRILSSGWFRLWSPGAKPDGMPFFVLLVSGGFAGLILLSVVWKGRWFCNTLCPAGGFLRLLAGRSLFRLRLAESCVSCGLCESVCPAGCITVGERRLDFDRCVLCLDCLDACRFSALNFLSAGKRKQSEGSETGKTPADPGRRGLLLSLAVLPLAVGSLRAGSSSVLHPRKPVMPPSAKDRKRFNRLCTSCLSCVNACPTRVLTPALGEYGLQGIFQPRMDFSRSFCEYECVRCTRVCPTGALIPLSMEEKAITVMGRVRLRKEACIVYRLEKDCGACAEHCPTQAVTMVPFRKVYGPETNPDICVGCGACEKVCPVRPRKAIEVDGLKRQTSLTRLPGTEEKGKPPVTEKWLKKVKDREKPGDKEPGSSRSGDFPF